MPTEMMDIEGRTVWITAEEYGRIVHLDGTADTVPSGRFYGAYGFTEPRSNPHIENEVVMKEGEVVTFSTAEAARNAAIEAAIQAE